MPIVAPHLSLVLLCSEIVSSNYKSSVREARRGSAYRAAHQLGRAVAWPDAVSILGGTGHDALGRGRPNAHAPCRDWIRSRELKQSDRQCEGEIPQTSRLLGGN